MTEKRKPYKAFPPIKTIHSIREKLYALGVLLKESHYPLNNFHAGRVKIANQDLESIDIGCSGKGRNTEYSLASAHGEFMERLQNSILFDNVAFASENFVRTLPKESPFVKRLVAENLILDFVYEPKEKRLSVEDSVSDNLPFYEKLLFKKSAKETIDFIKTDLNYNDLLSVPFYSLQSNQSVLLPIEIIISACGSNGMCAGNTKTEALIQGYSEIFERYAGKRMYFERITPPTIPLHYFKDSDIINKITKIKSENNYEITIKDCSLGINLPVLGLLIIDKSNRKYSFNLGADPNPMIALERCFTEIYQNPIGIFWNDINLTDELDNKFQIEKNAFEYYNGDKIFVDGTGVWPNHLFSSKFSYEFKDLNFELGQSDSQDLDFCLNIINQLGFQIFIRDVSFLGFPSFYIVIPGMSQFTSKSSDYTYLTNSFSNLNYLKRLKNLSVSEQEKLVKGLEENYGILKLTNYRYQNKLLYNTNYDIHDLDLELLLFMLTYRLEKNKKAEKYMNLFLEGKDAQAYSYFYAIRDFLTLKNQNQDSVQIEKTLSNIYGKNESLEVIEDLKVPEKIFQHYEWPDCFNCETCETSTDCKFFDVIKLIKKIQVQQQNNPIDQENIQTILNHTYITN